MKRSAWTPPWPDRRRIQEGKLMSEHVESADLEEQRPMPVRRPRASIREVMWLVAALAMAFRWPGLSVPAGLLFLYAFARGRDILRRQTRVAIGQIALAAYLPPAAGLLWVSSDFWDDPML